MGESTREALLQLTDFFLGYTLFISIKIKVNRLPVLADHVGHILRTLHSPFNLERRYARFDQLRHDVNRSQIFRR
ncbi:hypothetical protein D3C73_396760 [compost metagenome]